MMSNSGIMPHRTNMTNINQMDGDSVSATIPTTEQNTNSTRNATKRPKQGDDSFELEHRVVNVQVNGYANKFIIPPLPNLLFIRDAFSVFEKHVFIWQMAKSARQNEPLLLHTVFRFHPYLSTSGLNIVEWQTKNANDEYPTIEGGAVAYLGQSILLIGEDIAGTGVFRQIIVVIIPPQRDYMHLDTILSSVGKHAFTLHSPLTEIMEIFTVETRCINDNVFPKSMWISHVFNIRSGDLENGIINQMIRNNICQVGQIPSQGLFEGGRDAHCMTNAVRRRAK
ncbi:unnamed protein product [Rotaria socialis]|uniref:Uncharacterized protein n=1 Tax=Rotaria socialis TaxID=392032 RepID=A0A818BDT4_9BILA|nr:unnamed protein product [Rotaria socialis]